MHVSRREFLSDEKLNRLKEFDSWLQKSVAGETDVEAT